MSDTVLITGCAGLVGSECVRRFSAEGYRVIGVDNFLRGEIFGEEGDTKKTLLELQEDSEFEFYEHDIRDDELEEYVQDADAIVHTAAQPSHPRSIEVPRLDFEINVSGTLQLLEYLRNNNSDTPFVFCSTNKVYEEVPNFFSYRELDTRYEPRDPALFDGFDESLKIDQNQHTPFGVSKAAADLYVQEYAHMYDVTTGVFRMGCITGSAARAVEHHNWEPFFVKKALREQQLTLFGYKGKQVRDVIHARDLADLFLRFVENPRTGVVYNVGGGRDNSISLLESIDLIENLTGKTMDYGFGEKREADHQWWISNLQKVQSHFPDWQIETSVEEIFREIVEYLSD